MTSARGQARTSNTLTTNKPRLRNSVLEEKAFTIQAKQGDQFTAEIMKALNSEVGNLLRITGLVEELAYDQLRVLD